MRILPRMADKLQIGRRTLLGMGGAAVIGHSLGAFSAWAQTSSTAAVKVEKDVVVGKGGDIDLHCDIYRPTSTPKRMATVFW